MVQKMACWEMKKKQLTGNYIIDTIGVLPRFLLNKDLRFIIGIHGQKPLLLSSAFVIVCTFAIL